MPTGVVIFDPAGFKARFAPHFANVADATLQAYFSRTGLYLNNTEGSKVRDVDQRSMLLDLLVAHIATMSAGGSSGGASGRMTSASEGSVSASFAALPMTAQNSWYMSTPYGQEYWMLMARYRTARYITGRSLPANYGIGRGYPWLR